MMFRCNHQNTTSAAAFCTDAASCCANANTNANTVMTIVDAIVVASIIICALLALLGLLFCAVIDLVLVAVVSIIWQMNTPMVRARAS